MNNKKTSKVPTLGIIISIFLSLGITFLGSNDVFGNTKNPIEAYRVYLKGESLGLIESEEELYKYIQTTELGKELYSEIKETGELPNKDKMNELLENFSKEML